MPPKRHFPRLDHSVDVAFELIHNCPDISGAGDVFVGSMHSIQIFRPVGPVRCLVLPGFTYLLNVSSSRVNSLSVSFWYDYFPPLVVPGTSFMRTTSADIWYTPTITLVFEVE